MVSNKHYRSKRPAFADLLNYASLIAPGVALNKNGSLTAGFYYRGSDLASSTLNEVADVSARVNAALTRLGSGWVVHVDAIRISSLEYPAASRSYFPDRVTGWIENERRMQFERSESHFESIYALILTYLPPLRSQSQLGEMMFDDARPAKANRNAVAERTLEYFEHILGELEESLSVVVQIERMGSTEYVDEFDVKHTRDALLEYINFAITGENHPINLPPIPMYLDAILGTNELFGGVTPKLGDKFIATVAIDGFPADSYPRMLHALDELPFHYRWSSRYILLDQHEAEAEMKKYRRKWAQKVRGFVDQVFNTGRGVINQDAADMVEEVDDAIAQVNNGAVLFGYFTSVIVVMGSSRETTDLQAREVRKIVQALGFSARIETVNALEAWLGTFPGHVRENIRRPLINTIHFSDIIPLAAIWPGRDFNPSPFFPEGTPPLFHAATDGATPFRCNLHVGDLGHTLIFGPTGAGKSVLLAFLAAQWMRYKKARVFCFDKGKSLYALTHAVGGHHYDIGSDSGSPTFAPLAAIDTDADLAWAEEWVSSLIELQGLQVTPAHRNKIHDAMLRHRNSPKAERDITTFVANLQDTELREALQHYTLSGAMGSLLDSREDSLTTGHFQTFEIETLLNLGHKNALPVLLYLFRQIEKSLDGSPTLIQIDEAWVVLAHQVFKHKIREWLKVLRKSNAVVVLATQSLSDAAQSGLIDVLIEACPTKIYLPNPDAAQPGLREFYTQMGLNPTQIRLLTEATKKRDYYLTSPEGRRMFQLNLGPIALAFVATSSREDVAAVRKLIASHGPAWPEVWLAERHIEPPSHEIQNAV